MSVLPETAGLFIDAWSLLIPRLPTGEVLQEDGVVATLAHVGLPFLNACFHDGPLQDREELRARLSTARRLAAWCSDPWYFVLCEKGAPSGWRSLAEEEGLSPHMVATGMVTDALAPPRRPLPEMDLRRVRDEGTARDIAELNALAYGLPLSMVECLFNLHLWRDDAYGYVGYVDGTPVSCSATFPVGGTVYVAFVATHPDYRRRGCAEAVMRHSVAEGRQGLGFLRTALHATEAGRPLYTAMGYRRDATFHLLAQTG